jgi:hypothetical protein
MQAMKSAMNEGLGVVFATPINKDFMTLTGPWQTQKLGERNAWNSFQGYHAMIAIGYDDSAPCINGASAYYGGFLVENSWGKDWGDGGFCGWSYGKAYTEWMECWVIRGFVDVYINPVQHLHTPTEVIGWFHSVWRYDVTDADVDHPAVLYWADSPGGYHAFLQCEKDNHNALVDKLLAANP